MPPFAAPRYDQFLQQILGTFVVRGGLTDVSDSSRAKYLAAAASRLLDELSYETYAQQMCWSLDTATGLDLERRAGEQSAGNVVRRGAVPAQGEVVFYTLNPGGNVSVPLGTEVRAQDGTRFATTASASIDPSAPARIPGHSLGQDTGPVPVVALDAGAAGNQAAGALSVLGQRPTGIDGVQNPAATQFGQDAESDDALRARVRTYAASLARSTPSAIIGAVLGAQDPDTGQAIAFASLIESETQPGSSTLYIDDGSGQAERTRNISGELLTDGLTGPGGTTAAGGETTLSLQEVPIDMGAPPRLTSSLTGPLQVGTDFKVDPLDGSLSLSRALTVGEQVRADYTAYTGLVALAQKIVDGDAQDSDNFPGYRAAGTRVAASVPQTVSISVSAIVAADPSFDAVATRAAVQAALIGHINGLSIGAPVQVAKLTQVAMAVPGVRNFTPTAPKVDLSLLQSQLGRTDASRVQVS